MGSISGHVSMWLRGRVYSAPGRERDIRRHRGRHRKRARIHRSGQGSHRGSLATDTYGSGNRAYISFSDDLCYDINRPNRIGPGSSRTSRRACSGRTGGEAMTGWICPKCGRVYAPTVASCSVCNALVDHLGPHQGQTVVRPQMTRDVHQQTFEAACEKEAHKP